MAITHKEAVLAVKRYGSIRKAAIALRLGDKTISTALKTEDAEPEPETVRAKRHTISENDLLEETDEETKVTNALREEVRSFHKAEYIRDTDLRKECHGHDTALWREVRIGQEFWPYAMMVGNSANPMIYWGHPDSVKSMIERGKARKPGWIGRERL